MPQVTRRDFEKWSIEEVFKLQEGTCHKCGNPLGSGFHRHHKDGNNANNTVGNLELLCPRCHGGEAFGTFVKQMAKLNDDANLLIKKALDGDIAGTVIEKTLDTIKLSLSLNSQLYGYGIEKPPASIQAQQYVESSRILLEQWEDATKQGILRGLEMAKEIKKV
jgi:hypothetical protein